VELGHTEVWSSAHLNWFNVDFDPAAYHSIPISMHPIQEQGPQTHQETTKKAEKLKTAEDQLLELLCSMANAYRE
jgi:hypothetical protein